MTVIAAVVTAMMSAAFNLALLSPSLAVAAPDYSTTTLERYAETVTRQDGLNVAHLTHTLDCESAWQWDATSTTADWGVVQIHLEAHPDVSGDQSLDPYWSIDWAAAEWSAGRASEWVCYRNLLHR